MELSTKALYNALRFRALEERGLSRSESNSNSWKIADYRSFSLDMIYKELGILGQTLDKESFLAYANECDTPEELVDILLLDTEEESPELSDHLRPWP